MPQYTVPAKELFQLTKEVVVEAETIDAAIAAVQSNPPTFTSDDFVSAQSRGKWVGKPVPVGPQAFAQ